MSISRRDFLARSGSAFAGGAALSRMGSAAPGRFTAEAESLKQYQCPEWFRDAKLGFWACWGPEAVPEMGDWYAHNMYVQGHPQYEDHCARYGHPSKAGYKDLVPLWSGENWDPDRLMSLYQKAGAKYFCAIAQHHDNIDCWNSKFHKWNSVKMGPHRDVIGTWTKTARKYGLRFGVTEHLGASWNWFGVSKSFDARGPLAGVPYDGANSRYDELYHSRNEGRDAKSWYRDVPESFQREWFNRIQDLVDSCQPDLLYSDGSLPFGEYGRKLLAHFYNSSIQQYGGNLQAVYNCKDNDDGGQFIRGSCIQDVERGVLDGIGPRPWQTDTCIGDWYYKKDIEYKTPTLVLQILADVVSKNGNLLLNFPLKKDGTLDAREEAIIESLTGWMAANGEAIFGTRPWRVYGEGAAQVKSEKFNEKQLRYTSEDIRFTTKEGNLYVIALAWPESGKLNVRSLSGVSAHSVHLLGSPEPLKYSVNSRGVEIEMPATKPHDLVFAVRLEGAAG